jgi:hypothetical protein
VPKWTEAAEVHRGPAWRQFCQNFEVKALEPGKLVVWKATKDGIDKCFKHAGWRANTEFFAHCSMQWATFLMSFKDPMEKSSGRPAPNDIPIEHR